MALSDLMANFRGGTGQPPANPTPPTPGNMPPSAGTIAAPTPGTAANGIVPPAGETPNTNEPANPLDEFKSLWENDPNAPKPDEFGILGEINAQKIQEVAGKVNFAKTVNPADIKLIQAGGDEAIAALGRALNATSQAVYGQSAVATSKLIEQASAKLEAKLLETLPAKINKQNFSNQLREENPAYSHPAAAPIVSMIESQIATKFPNATPSELTEMAQDYFTRTMSAISGKDKKEQEAANLKASKEIDWAKEFNV